MKTAIILALSFVSFGNAVFGQVADNTELQRMYDDDQHARATSNIDWTVVSRQDSLRGARVFELAEQGKLITATDFYNAALIMQHGSDTLASAAAILLMRKAIELDPTLNTWLLAAAIDRDLMRRDRPQIYGTQFIKNSPGGKWERYKIDTSQVTDSQRRMYHVETLAEQQLKEWKMNLLSISDRYARNKSVDEVIKLIKTERNKKGRSKYNVDEDAINDFGYELLLSGKDGEALRIFKLNTELTPNSFNSFDSYGECLVKMGKKQEGLKAYKRSLELNPRNDNARKVLEKNK